MAVGQHNPDMSKRPQDSESRHADKYIVRFPDGMRDRLKASGQAAGRSLNAEIVFRLEQSFRQQGTGMFGHVIGEPVAHYASVEGGKGERIREMLQAVKRLESDLIAFQRENEAHE
ncbi:MAG TPA: Arc family DNA-binding protein [Azoarcus taiwanensis]|nr:Arc family DNA-binding protein [Azoarcus taiwanensis]